jgi:hypothetical protein
VAHPQHPLNRQIVKVLKREGRHWIIEKADGSQEKLPLAWAETVPSIIAQANRQDEPWAGVTELLNLVKIVERLRVQPPEEVDDESQPGSDQPRVHWQQPAVGEQIPDSAVNPAV